MSDDNFDLNKLSSKEKDAIEKILDGHGGESDDTKLLKPLPDTRPDVDHSDYSREMLWEKKSMLEEHLGVLEESLLWAINDVDIFEQKMELNPAKKIELVQAVENIGQEIKMVRDELNDIEKNL